LTKKAQQDKRKGMSLTVILLGVIFLILVVAIAVIMAQK
jgi:flagellar basal body-associated protein FliL